jgi:polyphosphate kinase 2 (PPK2 family)
VSPIDEVAVKNWEKYSDARNEMFARTHTTFAPWQVVHTDDKHAARVNLMKAILGSLDYKGKDESLLHADPAVVFTYSPQHVRDERIAP